MERTDRIEEEIKKVASKVISQDLKDPRLTGLISITRVNVTKDLKYCKIFVSMLGSKNTDEAIEVLKSGSGLVRKAVGNNIRMHSTPEIIFELDDSIEYGAHIQNVINELNIKHDDEEENEE